MAAVAVIAKPLAEGMRQALVLTEDRLGHYPDFRDFFVRMIELDRVWAHRTRLRLRAFGRRVRVGVRGPKRRALPVGARGGFTRSSKRWSRWTTQRSTRPVGDPGLDGQRRGSPMDDGGPSRDRPAVSHSRDGMTSSDILIGKTATWSSLTRH